jgi:hypothetical protein|tara:strand:- start:133 stop:558 length:426 start_codon:yes stop_codon:yes gene_type:complete
MDESTDLKNKSLGTLRKALKIQHEASNELKEVEQKTENAIKLQNKILGLGVIECEDISHSRLNTPIEYKNSDSYNNILNEIKDVVCDVEGTLDLEGFENMNLEIFNRLSLNDHCTYILIILFLILIFKKQIMNSKYIKNLF